MNTTQIATSYQVITDRILALLEHGTVPWQQPWQSNVGVPRNSSASGHTTASRLAVVGDALPIAVLGDVQQVKTAGAPSGKASAGCPSCSGRSTRQRTRHRGPRHRGPRQALCPALLYRL